MKHDSNLFSSKQTIRIIDYWIFYTIYFQFYFYNFFENFLFHCFVFVSIPVLFQLFRFFMCEINFHKLNFIELLLGRYRRFFFLDYPFIWFAWYYILSLDYNLYTYINSTGGMKYTKFYDNFLNWIYYSLLNTYVIKNQKI